MVASPPDVAVEIPAKPQVGYVAGCWALFEDLRCVSDGSGKLSLWIDHVASAQSVELRLGQHVLGQRTGSGLLRATLGEDDVGRLSVLLAEQSLFEFEYINLPQEWEEAWTRANVGDPATVQAAFEREQALATGLVAELLECDVGRAAFENHDPVSIARARQAGVDLLCEMELAIMAAHEALDRSDFALARQELDAAKVDPMLFGPNVNVEYEYWGLEQRLGRIDASLRGLTRVAERARELELGASAAQADIMIGRALSTFGQFAAALQMAERALAVEHLDEGFRLEVRQNAAWIQFEAWQVHPELPDPTPELRELVQEFEGPEPARDLDRAASARLDLILALLHAGDDTAAQLELRRLDLRRLDLENLTYFEVAQARLAQHQRRIDRARGHIEQAELYASLVPGFDTQLLATLGRANLERAAGDAEAARLAYERAQTLADRVALGISPSAGSSLFGERLHAAQAEQLELQLELDDPAAALCSVLNARARYLRSLAAGYDRKNANQAAREQVIAEYERKSAELVAKRNDRWALTGPQKLVLDDELTELSEQITSLGDEAMRLLGGDEVAWQCADVWHAGDSTRALLAMYPATADGWWFALARGSDVRWEKISGTDSEAMIIEAVGRLLDADTLAGVTALHVVPILEMIDVDVHRLARVRELGVPVVYQLGLGDADRPAVDATRSAAVVIGRNNLLHAGSEHAYVRQRLQDGGWALHDWQPELAEQPTLLHFVGHGAYDGIVGWDSKLVLPERELSSSELIGQQHAPRQVVLDACSTSRGDATAIDGGMNMATAFLLAGSELVIAPDQDVEDPIAETFARALYAEAFEPGQLARALWRVQADPGFAAWRAWVR